MEFRCPTCGCTEIRYIGVIKNILLDLEIYECYNCKGVGDIKIFKKLAISLQDSKIKIVN